MEKLRNLTYVNIGYNKVQSLKELRNCKKMDRLYAFYNELKDLKGLNKMKELKILSVDGNRLTSLAGVEKLNSLKTLSASRNRLADIKGVEGLSNLRKLFVGMNCLTGLEETAGLKGLRMIHAERNRLKNLPDLRSLRLTSFRFAYNFLDEQEFWTKLPQKLLNQTEEKIFSSGQVWLKDNIKLQNLDYSIELIEPSNVNQITKDTTRIVGRVNEKGASVMLTYDYNYQDHWICDLYAKADETGRFEFQNLDFKKQGGRLASLSFGMNAESTKNLNNGSCYYVECSQFRIKK